MCTRYPQVFGISYSVLVEHLIRNQKDEQWEYEDNEEAKLTHELESFFYYYVYKAMTFLLQLIPVKKVFGGGTMCSWIYFFRHGNW